MNNKLLDRDMLFKQIKFFMFLFFGLSLCAGILIGCGSSGDGGGGDTGNEIKNEGGTEDNLPPIDSTEGLNWDEMEWDQAKWG